MQKIALITGVTGQDGRLLAKFLHSLDYKIYGLISGQKYQNSQTFMQDYSYVNLINGDLTDFSSLVNAINVAQPDEIYNLGAISFVGMSFQQPEITANVTGLGTLRLLEAMKVTGFGQRAKFYQASSSEMYGKVVESPQNEETRFYPRSPYGVAKTFAHYSCVNYREAYGMHISSGILFNHESEYRGHEFVTRKITSNIARIKLGLQDHFTLGSLDSKRDWGYAGDYVKAMWLMVQQEIPDTFVIATGECHSVLDFLKESLNVAGLDNSIDKYVKFDLSMVRPSEVDLLIGDYSKARKVLGWEPEKTFKEIVEIMIENDLRLEHKNLC